MSSLIDTVTRFAEHHVRAQHCPGLQVAIALDGALAWEGDFGSADLATEKPMAPDTVFRSGSMGKMYTLTAVMQLVERGAVALREPINTYLDFTVQNPLGERGVTVHDLLTHRSGLAGNAAASHLGPTKPLGDHLREVYSSGRNDYYHGSMLPLWSSKTGSTYFYSNTGMATLGYIVEQASGVDFSTYVQRHILDPLGMTSTQFVRADDPSTWRPDIVARRSTGYAGFGPIRIPTPEISFADWPAGFVLTTPSDHIKLLLAYVNGGMLEPDTVREVLTPQYPDKEPPLGVVQGLGWKLHEPDAQHASFGHGGAHMFGWHNDFRAFPKLGLAVAVSTNVWTMTGVSFANPLIAVAARAHMDKHVDEPAAGITVPPGWKTSYVIGVFMAGQLDGMLSISEPIDDAVIDAMVSGVACAGEATFHPDAFRDGMQDVLKFRPLTVEAMTRAMDAIRLPQAEFDEILTAIGGPGMFYTWRTGDVA